jgi:hypothetical protein
VCGVERSGKCFCPPLTPQRDGDYKGLGTPLPVCARLWTACMRCTSLWHCAGLPVGIARCAGTIDPGSKGCASHTRPGWPSDGWPDGALRSGRKGTAQLNANGLGAYWIHAVSTHRLKACAMQRLTPGSRPIANMLCLRTGLGAHRIVEGGQAIPRSASINTLDVCCSSGITAQGHWRTSRWLTRRSVVLLASSLSASCQ